ncbi:MAG: hypothetical protein AB7I18_02645 [Candidatus Berkiella sp.]
MPGSRQEDLIDLVVKYDELSIQNGPESWQLKDFLNDNKDKLNIGSVGIVPQKEVRNLGDAKEVLEFDLVYLKDGSVVKANITTKKEPDGDGNEGNKSSFSVDMSKIKDPADAKLVLAKLLDVALQTQLRFHPAGTELKLHSEGMGRWAELAKEVEKEKCAEYAQAFQEKGIKLYINDKLMIDDEPDAEVENSSQEKHRSSKPWDVPKGAPDAKPKR